MTDKQRIAELERRVRDLEARPFPIYVGYPLPASPCPWPQPIYYPPQPWAPPPITVTCGTTQ